MTNAQLDISTAQFVLAIAQAQSRSAWKAFHAHASNPHAGHLPSIGDAIRTADAEVEKCEADLASAITAFKTSLKRSSR